MLVDEFQDTNGVQYDVLKLLASDSVFVVGDSDQAIYGWRGADYENQQRYDDDFGARLLKLEGTAAERAAYFVGVGGRRIYHSTEGTRCRWKGAKARWCRPSSSWRTRTTRRGGLPMCV